QGSKPNARDLPREVLIAVGALVLVTQNIDTNLDIANGARGHIERIVFDPREPDHGEEGSVVHLRYMPKYVLVKLERTRVQRLEGLQDRVVPIAPVKCGMKVTVRGLNKSTTRTINRRQLPVTPAYAFTDYRAQGQTLPAEIVDIAKVPVGPRGIFFVTPQTWRTRAWIRRRGA
ncbi:hypothetical protein GGF50DRAFT_60440, partial [Schizophyllum commune]